MHVGRWGVTTFLRESNIAALLLLIPILLTACTERTLEMGFLDKAINGKGDFTIDNDTDGGSFVPVGDSVGMEISCDRSIEKIEAENPQTQQWKDVTQLATDAQFDCASGGKAKFKLPLEHIAPYTAPTEAGDMTQDFQIRWYVKNLDGETYVFNRTLTVVFFAPEVSVTAANINASHTQNDIYTIDGTCQINGGVVYVEGPFTNASLMANCENGQYSAVGRVKSTVANGNVLVTVRHYASGSYRSYGQDFKTVTADTVVPVVQITSPTQGQSFNQNEVVAPSSIAVQGTCSEEMTTVRVLVAGVQRTETTCSAVKTFTAYVPTVEGDMTFEVVQADAHGNSTTSDPVTVFVDTQGPGAFTISGVRNFNGVDAVVDAFLRETGMIVEVTASASASTYKAYLLAEDGTQICESPDSLTSINMTSCPALAQNTYYKLYVFAKDDTGNQTGASNTGFRFKTEFPVPQVTRIYTSLAGAHFGNGASVSLKVEYDRAVKFVGASRPSMNLNTGVLVTATSLSADNRTLNFTYVVFNGNYAFPLGVSSSAFLGCAGCMVDLANNAVEADTALPANGTANGLTASSVKVDALAPSPVTTISVGAVGPYYTESPTITFQLPADPDSLTSEIQLRKTSNNSIVKDWTGVSSPTKLSSFLAPLEAGATYSVVIRLKDPLGNISTALAQNFVAFACPAEFVYVHNSNLVSTPFCVGQFEAKNDGTTKPRFIADLVPENLSNMNAVGRCTSLGAGYDLIKNNEWLAIADLAARQPENWTGSVMGSGLLHRGHNQGTAPVAASTADACSPNTSICASNALRRSLKLPYNQEIWDFAGNAAEAVKETDSTIYSPAYVYPAQNGGDQLNARYGTTALTCGAVGGPDYCGFGKVDFTNVVATAVWRGGAAGEGNSVGVFTAKRSNDVSAILTNGGYRCVYHP